jgi:hypothetical protein
MNDSSMKPLEFEIVSVAEAKRALEGEQAKQPDASQCVEKRVRISQERLLHITRVWLASLPQEVRPINLVENFPRIANRLRYLWKNVARCEAYLDDLLVDRRGDRKGFPLEVSQELTALRDYYSLLHPDTNSVWSHVEGRK